MKLTAAEQVEALMAALDHPLKAEIEALRAIIKTAGPELAERVKWNAPSYYLGKHDMAAFNLRQTGFVQLVLVFPGGLMIEDRRGLLEGDYKDRRLLYGSTRWLMSSASGRCSRRWSGNG